MHTKKPVSTIWLLIALVMGVTLFLFIIITNEMKPELHVTLDNPSANTSPSEAVAPNPLQPITDRFKALPVDDLSTPLNTRFEDIRQDPYCLNSLTLNTKSTMTDWGNVREYLDGHFYDDAGTMELSLRALVSDTPDSTTISICRFAEELYVIRQTGAGEEFAGYDLVQLTNPATILTPFILPLGRVLEMRTNIFEDDALFISARQGDASYTAWYYFKFNPEEGGLEQVEWCDRWYGGGNSPYGDDPNLTCEYTYAF